MSMLRSIGFAALSVLCAGLAAAQPSEEPKGIPTAKRFDRFEAFSIPQTQVDKAYTDKLAEEIQLLTTLGKQRGDPNSRADILSRMAEAYILYDKANYFRGMARWEKEMDLYVKGKSKVKPAQPEFSPRRAHQIFQEIIRTAPKYGRMDEVLFQTGFYGQDLGEKNAVSYYERLIREHPKSRFRLDAHMQVGESYFEKRELQKAVDAFKTVLREPSKIYNFALYKLAWCYYNQGQVRSAMASMQNVVKSSKGVQNEIELREEALKDLVLFYSDLGLIDEAQQYFVAAGEPEYATKVLEKLSEIYYSQARYEKAIETLKRLIAAKPLDENTPKNHSRLIECHEKSQQGTAAMAEMQTFITAYDRNSAWWKQNTATDARDYAHQRSEVYARFAAKRYHELGQQVARTEPENSEKYFRAALFSYKKYLDMFPDHSNAYEMRFLYAELLFKQKNYPEAAREFEKVAKANPKGRRRKDALIGQIDALSRLEEAYLKDLDAKGLRKKGKYDPLPLSSYANSLVEADELYVKSFPRDPKIPDTLLHRGQVFYNYNQLDKAQKGFVALVDQYPKTAAANTARHLILDTYNIKKDWENLEKTASAYLATPGFATEENRELLLKLIQGSIFQRARDLEDKKKYAQAAEMYMRLTTRYPDSEFADKAMFNAALDYVNADMSDRAMETSQAFLRKYPGSPLVPKMMLALAGYFDDKLDYAHAAMYYELLAEKDPKSPSAPDALFNAGLYRENLRHFSRALEDYNTYLEKYRGAKDAAEIFFSTGLVHEKMRKWREAAAVFRAYPQRYSSNKDRVIEAYYRLAGALEKTRDLRDAQKAYQTAVYLNRKYNQNPSLGPNIGGKYAAKSRFELVKPEFDEYNAIKLRMPQSYLARAITQKAQLLTRLKDRYLEIINYGDAEMGVAALYQIGLIYQSFSAALFNAPVPKGLTPEEVQTYQTELQNRAAPIEEKAVEAFEKAVAKSIELEVYSDWSRKSYDRLTQFKPDRYPPLRGRILARNHVSEPIAVYVPSAKGGGK